MGIVSTHLWVPSAAREALAFYVEQIPGSVLRAERVLSQTPGGPVTMYAVSLAGKELQVMECGSPFTLNQSMSLSCWCPTAADVERLWAAFTEGATIRIPLDTYPFSSRYGWLRDRFGLDWQFGVDDAAAQIRVVPNLLFGGPNAGRAADALALWTSVIPNSRIVDTAPRADGTGLDFGRCLLDDMELTVMDDPSTTNARFNESMSFMVACPTQGEINRVADALTADPDAEQCGWLKDHFGVSWQVVPDNLEETMFDGTTGQVDAVTREVWQMKRLDKDVMDAARAKPQN